MDAEDRRTAIEIARGWMQEPIAILDTETTGLTPGEAEIISIAIIDGTGKVLLDSYIKPTKPINEVPGHIRKPSAFDINGISNEMVKNAPTFLQLWLPICKALDGKRLICYNEAFDGAMLDGDRRRNNLPETTEVYRSCAMLWYAAYNGDWNDYYGDYRWVKLTTACQNEGLSVEVPAHRCVGDCLRTLALIQKIAQEESPHGVLNEKGGE